jgi:transposase-like protein
LVSGAFLPGHADKDFALASAPPARGRLPGTGSRPAAELLLGPQAHWQKLRTTNVIERAFREVRRRTRPMSSFSNQPSCDRIIYAVVSHLNLSWGSKPLSKFTHFT